MPDIKDIKDVKEVPGRAFSKKFDDLVRSFTLPPRPLHYLNKMELTTLTTVVANLKALKATVIESSRQANRLSAVIKNLTWVLVGLTAAAVILAAISLYILFSSAK
jgi:hypothetical protein